MSGEPPATLYIVDDDPDMLESLAFLMKTVGISAKVFTDAESFLREYNRSLPGVLLTDVRMPGCSGLELVEKLRQEGIRMPVIFITAYADVPMAVRALKSGMVEFLEKPCNTQTLLEKVQKSMALDITRCLQEVQWREIDQRFLQLTDRERESLALLLDGLPNKGIAARLQVTERTVEMRRASIMKKLRVHSMAELIRLVTLHELRFQAPTSVP